MLLGRPIGVDLMDIMDMVDGIGCGRGLAGTDSTAFTSLMLVD